MFVEALDELKSMNPDRADRLQTIYQKHRQNFFNDRINELNALYQFTKSEEKQLWGTLLSVEQPSDAQSSTLSFFLLPSLADKEDKPDNPDEGFALRGLLKLYWSSAWREFAEEHKATLVARYVLRNQKTIAKDETAQIPTAEKELISELNAIFPKANKIIGLPTTTDLLSQTYDSGILMLDQNALNYFKQHNIGQSHKNTINIFKKIVEDRNYNIEQRRRTWSTPLYIEKMIATCRWLDRTRKYVHYIQEKPAALAYPIFQQLSESLKRDLTLSPDGRSLESHDGRSVMTFDPTACIQIPTAVSILRANIPLLNSIITQRMVRWFLMEVHKQHALSIKEPHKLIIDGGYTGLGELTGAGTTNKALEKIKHIISLLTCCKYKYEDYQQIVEGNLLSYQHWQAKGHKASRLIISMEAFACPGFVEELPIGGIKNQRQRQLIPIVEMPIFVGRPNEHGSQACFQMELIIEMRLRAKEIYERGGILLNEDSLINLAEKARMPTNLIKRVLNCWIAEDYLKKIDDFVYNLGPRYPEAQLMLAHAGKKELEGSIAGSALKRKKQKKLFGSRTHIAK
jgi:hypothetical protein